jgi:hypothetical protein
MADRRNPALAAGLGAALAFSGAFAANAACPQALAVYSEAEAPSSLEFRPAKPAAVTTHEFRIAFAENGVVLDGIVVSTDEVVRPHAIVMHECPEGDVTGEELAACTVWEGIVYAVDEKGEVVLLPKANAGAAAQLVLPGFALSLRHSRVYTAVGLTKLPWDVYKMSGCQE